MDGRKARDLSDATKFYGEGNASARLRMRRLLYPCRALLQSYNLYL